jgi:hypothetical protein
LFVGRFVGLNVGAVDIVGGDEGKAEGYTDGWRLGSPDGCALGEVDSVGVWLGDIEGLTLGSRDGLSDGRDEGLNEGDGEGSTDGDALREGWAEGKLVVVGNAEGLSEGWLEGTSGDSNWAKDAARWASNLLCNSIPPMMPRAESAPTEMTIDPPTTASLVFEHLLVVDDIIVALPLW